MVSVAVGRPPASAIASVTLLPITVSTGAEAPASSGLIQTSSVSDVAPSSPLSAAKVTYEDCDSSSDVDADGGRSAASPSITASPPLMAGALPIWIPAMNVAGDTQVTPSTDDVTYSSWLVSLAWNEM